MFRLLAALLFSTTTAIAGGIPPNGYCFNAPYAADPYQAFGNLIVFGHHAERFEMEVPEEWARPHGFFAASYRGETVCKHVGPVTLDISIDLRGETYSSHPHLQIADPDGNPLLDRWIWPEYSCNHLEYDMTRSLRTYEGPLELGKLDVAVVDLARRLVVRLEGCRPVLMLRQPWPGTQE